MLFLLFYYKGFYEEYWGLQSSTHMAEVGETIGRTDSWECKVSSQLPYTLGENTNWLSRMAGLKCTHIRTNTGLLFLYPHNTKMVSYLSLLTTSELKTVSQYRFLF